MRSVLSDLYPEPRPGGSAAEGVQVTSSLPSTSALHRLSPVRSASSPTERQSLGSRSLSFIRSGVSAVSSLFAGPRRSGELQRTRSVPTPNKGNRQTARTVRPARPRTQSRGTGVGSPGRSAGTVSDGDSPQQPASRETLAGRRTGTGSAGPQTEHADQPAQQDGQTSDQQAEEVPRQLLSDQQSDQTSEQPPEQVTPQVQATSNAQTSDQQDAQGQMPSSKSLSATPPGQNRGQGRPGEQDLHSEGRSITSEATGFTDTETVDADEERASLASEPFSSGTDGDEDSQRGVPTTAAFDVDDDGASMAIRSGRRVTFDENAPDTLVFTPEQGGGVRGSDEESSVATASTDSDSEETPGDSFRRLLELLRERSLTPVVSYRDEGETSGQATVDPTGHVARYLREQDSRQVEDNDDDESDIQEGEVHPFREERRPAFPSEPMPGQRRTSFAEAIDEFLHYLQAIAEDHKAHQEAMTLLDEEPLPADSIETASEAGDSAWSETASETIDSVSEAGSVQTELDSGLATSPPPLSNGKADARGQREEREPSPGFGGGIAEVGAAEQNSTARNKMSSDYDAEREVQQEPKLETDTTSEPDDRQHNDKEQTNSAIFRPDLSNATNEATPTNNQSQPNTSPAVSSPTSNPTDARAAVETGGVSHDSNRPAETDQSLDQLASSETIVAGSESERGTSQVPSGAAPAAVTSPPTAGLGTIVSQPPDASSSLTRLEDSSRESSAAGSRRGSAVLRSILRASLPVVEVLGSHSDTDTLQERRVSIVSGTGGDLLPPTADIQGRSPGQAGSLEMMAKSPGELSKQPSPADSGGASEVVSESELAHHQSVRSFASIADQLLRGNSEEDAPRVVPSGVGPANSMAAISGQLLTDHSPGEPADWVGTAAIDEAEDETELHSIIMHGEVERNLESQNVETVGMGAEKADNDRLKVGKVELENDQAQKEENEKAAIGESDIRQTDIKEAKQDEEEIGETMTGEDETANVETTQDKTKEVKTGEATTEQVKTGEAATEEVKTGEAVTEEVKIGEPATEEVKTGEAATEEVKTGEAVTEELKTVESATEEVKTGEAITEEVKTREVTTEEVKTGKAATEEAKTGEAVAEEVKTGEAAALGERTGAAEIDETKKGVAHIGNEIKMGIKNNDGPGKEEEDGIEEVENEEHKQKQKDKQENTHTDAESKKVNNHETAIRKDNEEVGAKMEVAENNKYDQNSNGAMKTGEITTTMDISNTVMETEYAYLNTENEGTATKVGTEDRAVAEYVGRTSTGLENEGKVSFDVQSERTVASDDNGVAQNERNSLKAATKGTTRGKDDEAVAENVVGGTTEGKGNYVVDKIDSEPRENGEMADDKFAHLNKDNSEYISSIVGERELEANGADTSRNNIPLGTTFDHVSERGLTTVTEDDQARAIQQLGIPKQPEQSTSTTKGAPNIAIQTSTRLALGTDSLGSVTSDISRQESYESYSDDDERGSENGSEQSGASKTQSGAAIDDERAHLEALSLLDSERADVSSLQNTVRMHVQEERVMSEMKKRDEPGERTADDGVDFDSALSAGSTVGPKESDSSSSLFSDLRSEASEYNTGSEMDSEDYRKDRIRLTSDGESIIDDEDVIESETITRLGMLPSTTSARKLVWSLIAMASGIAEQVHGSETRMNTAMIDFPQSVHGQKIRSRVQFEGKPSHNTQDIDDSIRSINSSQQSDRSISDDLHDKIAEDGEMNSISVHELKEVYGPKVKQILGAAENKFEENLTYNNNNIDHSGKIDEELSLSVKQLNDVHGPKVKEILKAAENKYEKTERYDTQRTDHIGIPDEEVTPSIQLEESYRPKVKTILEAAQKKLEESGRYDTKNSDNIGKTNAKVTPTYKSVQDAIHNQIRIEAERTNLAIEQLKEIHSSKIQEVIKTAEDHIISAAQKIMTMIKQKLSKEITGASEHEAVDSKESNFSSKEVEPISERRTLIKDNEIINANKKLPVDGGRADSHENLANDVINGKANYTSSGNISKQGRETNASENEFLRKNVTYELISKQSYEAVNLDNANIRKTKDDLDELETPSPQDIASVAVAITQSILGEASTIVDDEQTAARRLRIRKSTTYATGGSKFAEESTKASMEEEADVTSEAPADSDTLEDTSPDHTHDETDATPRQAGREATVDTEATPEPPPTDAPADSAMPELSVEPGPPVGDESPPLSSLSASEESDLMIDEGQDTMDAQRIRYETGEIADQTQTVTSNEGITIEMLLAEPEEGAVTIATEVAGEGAVDEPTEDAEAIVSGMVDEGKADESTEDAEAIDTEAARGSAADEPMEDVKAVDTEAAGGSAADEPMEDAETIDTNVAGEGAADKPTEDAEATEDIEVGETESAGAEEQEQDGVQDHPEPAVEVAIVATDDFDVAEAPDSGPKLDDEGPDDSAKKVESSFQDEITIGVDGVKVSVMRVEEPSDPFDQDLMNLPTHDSNALIPTISLRTQSSFLAKDIVAPALLAMSESGSTVAEREAFAQHMAEDAAQDEDYGKKGDGDAEDILDKYVEDIGLESSGEAEETTLSESSSVSRETLKDEDVASSKDNVFDWLRRVSTQMDETGITDKLKEMYGEDAKKPIVMGPSGKKEEEEEEEPEVPEELPEMVSPKTVHSDMGMYHESSLSLDTTYRIRQSSTQTDAKEDGEKVREDAGAKGRKSAPRQKPCGSCPCCLAMKKVVSGSERREPKTGTEGVRHRPVPPKEQPRRHQQRPWTSPARSVGDLLDDASSTTISSTGTTTSVDSGDSYVQRMKHPKRWLKEATDEFMRRECIRQVVLKNDLVSDGRIQTKVTRISRHPSSMTDCLAATKRRTSPGQSLQMEISKGETVVGGRTVNYQDIKIRTPKSCSGLPVRSAARVHSSRSAPHDDVSKRFIDTYLEQSQAGLHSGRTSKNGRESKARKKITIRTDCRK